MRRSCIGVRVLAPDISVVCDVLSTPISPYGPATFLRRIQSPYVIIAIAAFSGVLRRLTWTRLISSPLHRVSPQASVRGATDRLPRGAEIRCSENSSERY